MRVRLTFDTEVASVNANREQAPGIPAIEDLAKHLSPFEREQAFLEARIQILTQEVVATSAIEGITIDPREARKAVLRRLALQAGLL